MSRRSERSSGSDPKVLYRHDEYYWEMVTFQVEDCLFRVPAHRFREESDIFSAMFSLPQGDLVVEGMSDNKPIVLATVKKDDFQNLLRVMYPRKGGMEEFNTLTSANWVSILRLSTMWILLKIRRLAIESLLGKISSQMSAIEKILLARECSVVNLLHAGLLELARRNEVISTTEAQLIGWETAVRLGHVREKKHELGTSSKRWGGAIEEELKNELKEALTASKDIDSSYGYPKPNRQLEHEDEDDRNSRGRLVKRARGMWPEA